MSTPESVPSQAIFSFSRMASSSNSSRSQTDSTQTRWKHRRVSLATESSPKIVPPCQFRDDTGIVTADQGGDKRGTKIRRIGGNASPGKVQQTVSDKVPRKVRRKWTVAETQMLEQGCKDHGVGNWKAILSDPKLVFDSRSPVDLKDRFRTSFPKEYARHYPNATTHLSSKLQLNANDPSSSYSAMMAAEPTFFKAPPKKRRPFTAAEDEALRRGYEEHGCVWAKIANDPIFSGANAEGNIRRSTDLRDRFRNAFPDLYSAAGYKPRPTSYRRGRGDTPVPGRSATTDDVLRDSLGSKASRAKKSRSVPASVAFSGSEAEFDSSDDEDRPQLAHSNSSTPNMEQESADIYEWPPTADDVFRESSSAKHATDFSSLHSHSFSETTDSSRWSMLTTDVYEDAHPQIRQQQRNMIGKSAWGTSDWFSANPRLGLSSPPQDHVYSDSHGDITHRLSSPFNAMHVFDRYDLSYDAGEYYSNHTHPYSEQLSVSEDHGEVQSAFSDPIFAHANGPMSFGGFTHHSSSAGDLIFGARTHQPTYTGFSLNSAYNPAYTLNNTARSNQQLSESPEGPSNMGYGTIPMHSFSQPQTPSIMEEMELRDGVLQRVNTGSALPAHDYLSASPSCVAFEISESHQTPPATPALRPLDRAHHRSTSVPPKEQRWDADFGARPRPPGHSNSQPILGQTSRRDGVFPLSNDTSNQPLQQDSQLHAEATEVYYGQGQSSALPFLDLHYFGGQPYGASQNAAIEEEQQQSRRGQALDLALAKSSSQKYPPSSWNSFYDVSTARDINIYRNRQSAIYVNPQDLQGISGVAKRKRRSMDAGGKAS